MSGIKKRNAFYGELGDVGLRLLDQIPELRLETTRSPAFRPVLEAAIAHVRAQRKVPA